MLEIRRITDNGSYKTCCLEVMQFVGKSSCWSKRKYGLPEYSVQRNSVKPCLAVVGIILIFLKRLMKLTAVLPFRRQRLVDSPTFHTY